MHVGARNHLLHSAPATKISRRAIISLTAKLAAGAALVLATDARAAPPAAAQNEIVLTAAASEVGAKPGSAYAQGFAALAAADQDAGATVQAGVSPAGVLPGMGDTAPAEGVVLEPPASHGGGH
jgi:hypothetical protein